MPNKTFYLKRDLIVARNGDSIKEGEQGLAVLYDRNTKLPKKIPQGARFTFDQLKEEYDYRVGVFPFFIGIGKTNECYTAWLKFPDYQVANRISGGQENLMLEYVWGRPGKIHFAPWEDNNIPELKNKRDLIRHIESCPVYSKNG